MANTVYGLFLNTADANNALDELFSSKFDRNNISVIVQNKSVKDMLSVNNVPPEEKAAKGAAGGAATGAALGALGGFLIGAGVISLPLLGGLLITGHLAAALGLTGVAATTTAGALEGALAGGLLGALVKLGIPEEKAKVYEERVRAGDILIAVEVLNDEEKAIVENAFTGNNASEVDYY